MGCPLGQLAAGIAPSPVVAEGMMGSLGHSQAFGQILSVLVHGILA
jgi:hypothetical protein